MNRQTVINKFIEKAGGLDPKPKHHFIQGTVKGGWGLTTEPMIVMTELALKYQDYYKKYPKPLETCSVNQILPKIHLEVDGYSYDWDTGDLVNCMRMLENKPFQRIIVSHFPNEPLPIALSRPDCDISVIVAPIIFKISPESPKMPGSKFQGSPWTNKGGAVWKKISQMPNCTFELWEFDLTSVNPPFKPDSVLGVMWGYPIARLLKCNNCGNESTIQDWLNRKIRENHPECMCSCNTYDDFCGCIRNRERLKFDRLYRQAQQKMFYIKRSHWDLA